MGRGKIILFAIILAFLLRFISVSSFPSGFSADEVNQGYTAYSLLNTGKDEWGEAFPIMPRSYGDYRAPLYTYLTIPAIYIFGLNEFAVRIPNVVIGTLAVLVVYFLCKEIFSQAELGVDGGKVGIIAAFLLAISPWHIALSRGAFEPNLPTLLYPLGILFFLKGLRRKNLMTILAVVFGLSLFAYYSSRMLLPLVLVVLFFIYLRKEKVTKLVNKYTLPVLVFSIFALAAFYTIFSGASTRILDVAIFSSKDVLSAVAGQKYQAVLLGLPDAVARIFSNKFVFITELFVKNYLGYFSFNFLFSEGASEATYGMLPGSGLLYVVEIIFLFVTFWATVVKKYYKVPNLVLVFILLLIAPIPAALSTGQGYAANRAAVMMPWITILSAFGAYWIIKKFKYLKYVLFAYFVFALIFFLESYFYHAPAENSRYMSYGWREAISYIKPQYDTFDTIIVSRNLSEPQMFVAFYMKVDPRLVQTESVDWLRYQKDGLKFVDQLGEYRLGKFIFKSIDKSYDMDRKNSLIMGRPGDFPFNTEPTYVVRFPDGKDALYLVSTNQGYAQKI